MIFNGLHAFLIAFSSFNIAYCQGSENRILRDLKSNRKDVEYMFFSTDLSWMEAEDKCRSLGSTLLCFSHRSEIVSLLQSSLDTWKGTLMWMGRRNCQISLERYLYIKIDDYGSDFESWDFSFSQQKRLPFICKREIIPLKTTTVPNYTVQDNDSKYVRCPQITKRDLIWPETPGNTQVKLSCPEGKIGYAFWFCNTTTGQWYPENPDLSDCNSVAMTQALEKLGIIDIQETTRNLHLMIQNLKYGGELKTAVDILDRVQDVYYSQAPFMTPAEKKQTINGASIDIVSTCDKLIGIKEAWEDIPMNQRSVTATQLLTAIDETGFLLTSNNGDVDKSIARDNVVLHVVKQSRQFHENYNMSFAPEPGFKKAKGRITLTVEPQVGKENGTQVVFAWFSDLRSLLPSEQLQNKNSPFDETKNRILNSPVMSANVSGREINGRGLQKSGEVVISLEHFSQEGTNPQCVYWDTQNQTWSTDGCRVVSSNASHTTCACNHLTNFAVLMDINCVTCTLSSKHKIALSIITMTGCLVSIFCLSICIIVFTYYRSLWCIRTTIHRNLCISLWFAEGILLLGLDRTENKILCSVIAGILHYLFLCVFFWMFLEAYHIMVLLISVFTPKRLHTIQHCVVGYGCPAIIVAITAGLKTEAYGTIYSCWLDGNSTAIWSYIGPVIVILVFNTVTLLKALWTTQKLSKSKEKMPSDGFKIWVRGAAVLLPLLGLTWGFGFLYFDENTIVFAYVFAILNSLQGLGIFIVHVLMNKKIQQLVHRSIQRTSLSRSGTTRTTKSSSFRSWPSSKKRKAKSSNTPPNSPGFETFSEEESPKSVLEITIEKRPEDDEGMGNNPRIMFLPSIDDNNMQEEPEMYGTKEQESESKPINFQTDDEDADSESENDEVFKYEEALQEPEAFRQKKT